MEEVYLTGIFVFILFLLLGTGVWVALALLGVAVVGMEMYTTRPAGDAMITTIWGASSSWTLTALPLFIWMGEILFRTRLSEDMFRGLAPWMARLPGGLLHTNIVGCTIFAAVSGSSAATLTTVGKMSIPELRKRNYPEFMTVGTLAGAATLGLMIPPSLTLIVYGVTINESISKLFMAGVLPGLTLALFFMAYVVVWWILFPSKRPDDIQDASLTRLLISIGLVVAQVLAIWQLKLGLVESILLVSSVSLLRALGSQEITVTSMIRPAVIGVLIGIALLFLGSAIYTLLGNLLANGPSFDLGVTIGHVTSRWYLLVPFAVIGAKCANADFASKIYSSRFLIPVILLISLVIGSMYTGTATATEAAAFGVLGALALALLQGSLNPSTFGASLMGAVRTSAMVAFILMGAAFLALAMGFTGLPRALAGFIAEQDLSVYQLIAALTLFYIVIGCFLDGISSVVLTMAIVEPMVNIPGFREVGFDMIWFGIFVVVVVEMAQITPPIGFNLFVMQSLTKHEMGYIAKAAFPMFLIMVVMVIVLVLIPGLATWLPDTMRAAPG